ncbi:ribosomal protein L21 [Ostertagia ostertagi]
MEKTTVLISSCVSRSCRALISNVKSFCKSIKFWPLADLLANVPVLRVVDIKKRKPVVKEGCNFCSTERREQYKCPRCNATYCSLRCYKCEKHSKCSEDFYKQCVKEELEGRRFEGDGKNQDTFEERMQKYLDGELDEMPGANANGAAADDADPLDSDDEEPGVSGFRPKAEQYLEKVVTDTVDDYLLDEDEIDRRLLGLGIGGEVEQLMGVLSEEERAAFAQLAEQINIDTSGLEESWLSISSEVSDPQNRLFAVVYVNGRQWKVGQNDLIALKGSLPIAVLMVGGSRFSVFGRPLLDSVKVEATVVEKSTTYPELEYIRNNHAHVKVVNWLSQELTVLRINEISAENLFKESSC